MNKQYLRVCPMCGGNASFGSVKYDDRTVKYNEWEQGIFYFVSCNSCGLTNLGLVGHKTREKAANLWNTRTEVK